MTGSGDTPSPEPVTWRGKESLPAAGCPAQLSGDAFTLLGHAHRHTERPPLFGNIHGPVLLQDLAQVHVAGHERVVHLLHGLLEHRVITQNPRGRRTTRDDHVVTVAVDPGRLGE